MNKNIVLENTSENINDVLVFTRTDLNNSLVEAPNQSVDYNSLSVEEKLVVDNYKALVISKAV